MLTWENFNELDRETAPPAKAGTPNPLYHELLLLHCWFIPDPILRLFVNVEKITFDSRGEIMLRGMAINEEDG